jgi:plasmid maintenance system killer protein
MDLYVRDNKLRDAIGDESISRQRYGADMAKKITLRIAALRASKSLADFWPPKSGPERCHELIGDRAGVFSVDLKQPYRLLFRASPESTKSDRSDEQQRWKSITAIEILAIEDTHA